MIIELRNSENHVHTVTRDPANDYGEAWLGAHVSRDDYRRRALRRGAACSRIGALINIGDHDERDRSQTGGNS